jgi:hypothetical protein
MMAKGNRAPLGNTKNAQDLQARDIAPAPSFQERTGNVYERDFAQARPGQRGPLLFEEGIASDTDVPRDFNQGMADGYVPAPGRPNQNNPQVQWKSAEETLQERAHVGSAAWVEAPTYLGEFSHGSFNDYAEVTYEEVIRPGTHQFRKSPAAIDD